MRYITAAVCQNKPSWNKEESISRVIKMVRRVADDGADLVVLPEIFYHPYELAHVPDLAERDQRTIERLRETARELKIHLCTGTTAEMRGEHCYNESHLIGPDGAILLTHRKCHLFNLNSSQLKTSESAVFHAGDSLEVANTELGKIGILICYDIRFPEAARALALRDAEIILVPAAFNQVTGPAHWHTMFKARAIENQVFIAAASPALNPDAKYKAYGHSVIVDPWGEVLAEADGDRESVIKADLDPERLREVRERLPLLSSRRPDIY